MLKTKCRMISIRISQDEYREIKSRCLKQGVASISEFVRAATAHALSLPELPSSPAFSEVQLLALRTRVDRLDEEVGKIAVSAGIALQRPE